MELYKKNAILENYKRVIERINQVAGKHGRNPGDIRLVVVTKTQPIEVVRYLAESGVTDLGENYVEEAMPKIESLGTIEGIYWHMIGHVQSRKANNVCEYFHYVHSVDSVKIAERLSRFCELLGKSLPVYLEFNVSGEASKFGWNIETQDQLEEILPDIQKIALLPNIELQGLMTVPPFSTNPEDSRIYFRRLRGFQQSINDNLNISGFTQLSMGMSLDFEVAIEEGSTCVRVGQAILGARP
jgi:pyridoxal phosphate enzyme (YggS family)